VRSTTKRAVVAATVTSLIASGTVAAIAVTNAAPSWTGLRAGVGVVDASWHLGAGAGQYASDADPSDEWDPNVQHVKQGSADGMASRLSIRALVLQDGKGDAPIALVKVDNYLAQDFLTRRVGQLLAADGSTVTYDNILMSATHDHNSPYYSTPAAGVWAFQDAMDLRMFEYQARQMAQAIETAEDSMVPARVGATTVQFPDFQGNIAGQDLDALGAPAGYPVGDNDHGLTVMRFDNMTNPADPRPLATYINYAQHGESLKGYDLFSADWLAPFERFMEEGTGVPVVFSQGSVGSSEGPYDGRYPRDSTPTESDHGDTVYKIFAHTGFAQAERGTHVLADQAIAAWQAIGGANNGVAVQAPLTTDPVVKMLTHWVAGPLSHPYPSVGNCRTAQSDGDPGVPAAGLPDCQRYNSTNDDFFGGNLPPLVSTGLYQQLKDAGVPVPDNYDATSFSTVEENMRIKLQAVRVGDTLLASCSCEAQSDLIRNLESRTDDIVGNQFLGFDYANQADVDEGWPDAPKPVAACHPVDESDLSKGYDCPNPTGSTAVGPNWLFGQGRITVSKAAFDHMEAEIHNDAAGWNDPSYVAQAGSEPTDITQIKGNFTHTELGAKDDAAGADGDYSNCKGYKVTAGLGHTGDYDGYTVSYREYMARDAYRKALTSYGPHTADYMNTNLVGMAANLMCGTTLIAQPTDGLAQADEARQLAEATLLGQLSSAAYDGWTAQIPDSAGPAHILTQSQDGANGQPWDVKRFDVTQVRWVGGDNWTDNPVVVVQRQVDGQWQDYTDRNGFGGEVQTFIDKPADLLSSMPTYRSGAQKWTWRASFEAFDSYPRADVAGGQVPAGTYRFVIRGHIHDQGPDPTASPSAYKLESQPFTVSPWNGLKVNDLRRDNAGSVSFTVDQITYPRTPPAAHTQGISFYKDDGGGTPGHGVICIECSFRPWAQNGSVATAVVVVTGKNGTHPRNVTASYDAASGRWVAAVPKKKGQTMTVPAGGVRDTYGEGNADGVAFSE
jgi:hypothetical protein